MTDTLRGSRPATIPHPPHKEGSRYHVVWWDGRGRHCSELRCELNIDQTAADYPPPLPDFVDVGTEEGRQALLEVMVPEGVMSESTSPSGPGVRPEDYEAALSAIDAMKVSADEGLTPADDWISVGVVRSILEGTHPVLRRIRGTGS